MQKIFKITAAIVLGVTLMVIGFHMMSAQNSWNETVKQIEEAGGTKLRNAFIGAGVGAVTGGVLAAKVGGIGVVLAGTGFGLPAGLALIALASTIGAGAGAVIGAAAGSSGEKIIHTNFITHVEPAYQTWEWGLIMGIGFILLTYGLIQMRKMVLAKRRNSTEISIDVDKGIDN